jgi:thiol-disulfide isomerase/thioredoxin
MIASGPAAKRPPHMALDLVSDMKEGPVKQLEGKHMRWIAPAVLYLAAALGANADTGPDIAALEALREGPLVALQFHDTPRPGSDLPFALADDSQSSLAAYAGKIVVLNFWATWCAPCRKEMPGLERLQTDLGGTDFAVVTLATGRNSVAGIAKFFDETGLTALPQYRDIQQGIARAMEVPGLPTTVILDRQGREVARLVGDAEWDTPSAKAILGALIAAPSGR